MSDVEASEEDDAALSFAVTLDPAATGRLTVDYATADGTATAGSDYTTTSGTLTFAAGEMSKTVSVPVTDDSLEDEGETLTLRLSKVPLPAASVRTNGSSDHVGNRPLAGGAGAVPAPLAPLRGSRRVVRGVIKARPPHLRTGRDLRAHRRRPTDVSSRIAAAETLWKICVPLVDFRRRQTFLEAGFPTASRSRALGTRHSCSVSLDRFRRLTRMPVFAPGTGILTPMPLTVHRFEQTIGGQHYVVEVRPALRGRWRASLVRTAGVPTALMPFYGATPRDALDALVSWLSHAHGVAA